MLNTKCKMQTPRLRTNSCRGASPRASAKCKMQNWRLRTNLCRGRRSRLRARSTRVLTVPRTVIHYARAASLPRRPEQPSAHRNPHGYALTRVGTHCVRPSKHPPIANPTATRHPERSEVLLREHCTFERIITINRSEPMQNRGATATMGSTKESL